MPIPFLIAGLVAAAAAVGAAIALSDDDKPSSSGSSSDSDDTERRHREAAEKERKKHEIAQKQEASLEDFQKQGKAFGKSLAQVLPSNLVKASGVFSLDFDLKKGRLQFDMEEAFERDADLLATIDGLETILTKRASHQKIIENLATFSELYKPQFQYKEGLQTLERRTIRIDADLEKLKEIKTQFRKLDSETSSIHA